MFFFLFSQCVMESGFLAVILFSSFAAYSSHSGITDWEDVVVVREGMPATLGCTDTTVRGAVAINWMAKSLGADEWKLVLSANEMKEFSGGASKASMRLTDPNFQDTGVFTLFFLPTRDDAGLYSCLIKQQERKLRERIILLAILTVTVVPAAPIPQRSTLRLIASVNPSYAATEITWASPDRISMKSEKKPKTGTVAKLPQVLYSDHGNYSCMVHPSGNSSNMPFTFIVDVIVDADNVASFTNLPYEKEISTATQAQTPHPVTCPSVQGDYVQLYWQPPDSKRDSVMRNVFEYNRWRGSSSLTEHSKKLKLAGPPYNAEAGSFSFLLTPGWRDGGLYTCHVIFNDNCISQSTRISVMKVKTSRSSSELVLECLYSERSQVQSVSWKHQNGNRKLQMSSKSPGIIITAVPLPITSDTAGNYTCILQLKNGQTVRGVQAVTLPKTGGRDVESVIVPTPSLLPSLSALLLLVPLVAAAVGVLLWRQKHISDRGIERSLSVLPSEAENIYENPEDMRQTPPQGSVYMDLKPRGEDDVYKELERY